jgi:hypothetical protein
VEERHGWALTQSHDKVQELRQELDDEKYGHLLRQEALSLRLSNQKQKGKECLQEAEKKQQSLHDKVVAADLNYKDLERQLRGVTSEANKAVRKCETLEASMIALEKELAAKCGELERTNENYEEANKEMGRLSRQVKNMEKELTKKGDLIDAQTKKATLQERALNSKLENATDRVEKYKAEVKGAERRRELCEQELKEVIAEQRHTINMLETNLDTLGKGMEEYKRKAKRREVQLEQQLNLSTKEAMKASSDGETAEAKLEELLHERRECIDIRESGMRGNPVNDKFARHVRALLASGASASATLKQLSLNARFFLNDEDYSQFVDDMPKLRWFQYQREGLGLESYLYTLTRVAKCDRVLQWGFDETSLDGVATLNQWARIKEGEDLHIVMLECTGLLVGSTASKVAEHVRLQWERGQEAIAMLREELGVMADEVVPLVNGGISLSKLGGVMHDTCNCANAIARRVRVLRDNSGKDLYGAEEWKRMTKEEHAWCDYFCGNHSCNVQFDAFSRLYEAYIKKKLGASLEAARAKSGGRVRVEPSGDALLRTICKLTHIGPKQYAKGQILLFIGH